MELEYQILSPAILITQLLSDSPTDLGHRMVVLLIE